MAVGGFKFAKMTAQYDSATMTIRQWGLKVHEARCLAFLDASNKGDSGWESISDTDPRFSGFTLDEREQEAEDGNYYTFIVAELITAADDSTNIYPAYMSVFKAPENDLGHTPEYMIVTAFGFKGEGNTTDKNVAIGLDRGLNVDTARESLHVGNSCMHAFAANGFNNFNLKSATLNPGELKLAPMTPYRSQSINRNAKTSDNYSLVKSPNSALTYYFGYAIKDDVIECFFKSSAFIANTGWDFMLLGRIFGDDCAGSDWPYGYASQITPNNARSDNATIEQTDTTYTGSQAYGTTSNKAIQTLNSNGNVFPARSDLYGYSNNSMVYCSTLCPCYMPVVSKTQISDEIPYCAYVMTFIPYVERTSAINGNGLDETNTLVKGMISTDILRCVSTYACRVGGATYSNGNFVTLYCRQSFTGMLVGWDPSNESLV